jgi:hypothetical protein
MPLVAGCSRFIARHPQMRAVGDEDQRAPGCEEYQCLDDEN